MGYVLGSAAQTAQVGGYRKLDSDELLPKNTTRPWKIQWGVNKKNMKLEFLEDNSPETTIVEGTEIKGDREKGVNLPSDWVHTDP